MSRNIFDPNGQAVAAKAFVFAGKQFKAGEVVPFRKMGRNPDGKPCRLTEHELLGLYRADLIEFVSPGKKLDEAAATAE